MLRSVIEIMLMMFAVIALITLVILVVTIIGVTSHQSGLMQTIVPDGGIPIPFYPPKEE